jgi:hypothetical protein
MHRNSFSQFAPHLGSTMLPCARYVQDRLAKLNEALTTGSRGARNAHLAPDYLTRAAGRIDPLFGGYDSATLQKEKGISEAR